MFCKFQYLPQQVCLFFANLTNKAHIRHVLMNPINGFTRSCRIKSGDHAKIMLFNSLNIHAVFDIVMK
jgi:hypothetical protein